MISKNTLSAGSGYVRIPQAPTPAATIIAARGLASRIMRSIGHAFLRRSVAHDTDSAVVDCNAGAIGSTRCARLCGRATGRGTHDCG